MANTAGDIEICWAIARVEIKTGGDVSSKRTLIQMSEAEINEFLKGRHILNLSTLGPSGWPHMVALWYGFYNSKIAFWTYGKSQKIANLKRDPRISALVESGDYYHELKGIEFEGYGAIEEDDEIVRSVGRSVFERYQQSSNTVDLENFMSTAPKRVAVLFNPVKIVSWDHSKLGSSY